MISFRHIYTEIIQNKIKRDSYKFKKRKEKIVVYIIVNNGNYYVHISPTIKFFLFGTI